jgi:ankyrin repeat protein
VPHQTALHGAAERGFTSFVKFLVERGADVQAKDANGRTALDLARGVGRKTPGDAFPETAKLLQSLSAAR